MPDVTEAAVSAALAAAVEHQRQARQMVWASPSRGQVRAMLEAAVPLVAPGREPSLTSDQCDRLRQTVTDHAAAIAAVKRALVFARMEAQGGEDEEMAAAAWDALKVLKGEELERGDEKGARNG